MNRVIKYLIINDIYAELELLPDHYEYTLSEDEQLGILYTVICDILDYHNQLHLTEDILDEVSQKYN